jgi:hypothetical protein
MRQCACFLVALAMLTLPLRDYVGLLTLPDDAPRERGRSEWVTAAHPPPIAALVDCVEGEDTHAHSECGVWCGTCCVQGLIGLPPVLVPTPPDSFRPVALPSVATRAPDLLLRPPKARLA